MNFESRLHTLGVSKKEQTGGRPLEHTTLRINYADSFSGNVLQTGFIDLKRICVDIYPGPAQCSLLSYRC